MSKKPQKKYIFSLIGVNIEKVDQKYGIIPLAISSMGEDDLPPENTTKILDLDIIKSTSNIVSFLDESKRMRKCALSIIDFEKYNEQRPYKCFWDKNPIPKGVQPIGCPIRFIPDRATKSYHSEITRERYTITESITEKRLDSLLKKKDKRISVEKNRKYESDGVFCSFNCCMAFIEDPENKHNPMYRHSKALLIKNYNEIHPHSQITEIMPAPHWRALEDFGGDLPIEKFRESFNKIMYVDHGVVSYMSLGRLYEDQMKF